MNSPQPAQEDIRPLLAQHQMAMTRPRSVFWSYLIEARRALTIPEIVGAMRERGVGRATAYRCIDLFTSLGLLREFRDTAGESCYVLMHIGDGHIVVCGKCHAVVELRGGEEMQRLAKYAEDTTGYSIYGSDLVVYGLCPDCRSAR